MLEQNVYHQANNPQIKSKKTLAIGWIVCLLGAVFYCYEYLLRIEPSVIVPELMRQFTATASSLGMVIALYYYAYTPLQMIVGILLDRYGARIILTLAVAVCAIGSFLFSNSHNLYTLGIGRFLIGFGSAFAFVGVLKLAAEWLPKHHFALFTGFTTALGMTGAMIGTMSLTFAAHKLGWHNTLCIGTVVGIIIIPLIWLVVRDTPQWKTRQRKNTTSFRQTFSGFWQIVKNKQMWFSGTIGCIYYLSLSVFAELWGIPFLRAVYNLAPEAAAMACSMVFAGWLIGSPLSGWLSDKTKTRKQPLIFGGFFAAAVVSIVIFKPFTLSFESLCILLFLFGLFSSTQIICFAISRENNPTHIAATAVGFTNLLIMLGGMIFQPLVGTILDFSWTGQMADGIRVYTATSYQHSFWILPIFIVLGSVLTMIVRETHPHKTKQDEFE